MGSIKDNIIENHYNKFSSGAEKEIEGKLRMDLIPPEVERAYAETLTFGASKYSDRNWERGIPYSQCVGALKRHLNSWLLKENTNEESGLNHIKHVLFWVSALTYFVESGKIELDDR